MAWRISSAALAWPAVRSWPGCPAPTRRASRRDRSPSSRNRRSTSSMYVELEPLVARLDEHDVAHVEHRVGDAGRVADRVGEVESAPGTRRVPSPGPPASRRGCRAPTPPTHGRGRRPPAPGQRERGLGQRSALGAEAERVPVAPQPAPRARARARPGRSRSPIAGRPAGSGHPVRRRSRTAGCWDVFKRRLLLGQERRGRPRHVASRRGLVAVGREPAQGVGLDGPQHAEPRPAAAVGHGDDEAPVGELEDVLESVAAAARRRAHRIDLFDVEAALEHGELVQQALQSRHRAGRGSTRPRRRASAGGPAHRGRPARATGACAARRSRMTTGGRLPIRAAASSMPSGRSSSERADLGDRRARRRPGSQPGRTARARSMNRADAVVGQRRDRAPRCSPAMWSGARLVTMIRLRGDARTRAPTSPAASTRCSMLSRTRTTERSAR